MKKNDISMALSILSPEDFARNFSPKKDAEVFLHVIDERPIFAKLPLGRFLLPLINPVLSNLIILKRDIYLKRIVGKILNKYGSLDYLAVKKFLEESFASDYLRKFEYSFLASCLIRSDVNKDIIVDFGGGGSFSSIIPFLLQIKYKRLISIDMMDYPIKSKYDIEYMRGDITKTDLPNESVDIVTIISTLEHVGLGRYGDPLDVDGDLKAMREARRILKKGGHIVLTIPYGYPTVVYNMHRVYDSGRFKKLMNGFKIVLVKYTLLGRLSSKKDIEGKKVVKRTPDYYGNNLSHSDPQGGVMVLLRKK